MQKVCLLYGPIFEFLRFLSKNKNTDVKTEASVVQKKDIQMSAFVFSDILKNQQYCHINN
jgi:hypothetical protein